MSIVPADLQGFLSANMPEDDTSISGGAIDTASKFAITQLASNTKVEVTSSVTETIAVTVKGRDITGTIVSEVINITTAGSFVAGLLTFERILQITTPGAPRAGTITVRVSPGGATIATLEPSTAQGFPVAITKVHGLFFDSISELSPVNRFEKVFMRNGHATLTLNSAKISQTSDPSGTLAIAVEDAIDDSASVANRKTTVPGADITAEGFIAATGTTINVPGNALPSGSSIGVFQRMSLIANQLPVRDVFDVKLEGVTA